MKREILFSKDRPLYLFKVLKIRKYGEVKECKKYQNLLENRACNYE